jgi:hypothetical protein
MSPVRLRDVVILVADKNMEFALRGVLSRTASLRIEPVLADIFVHPEKDPGCLLRSDAFLRPFQHSHDHALVLFDREGCGREDSRPVLEADVEARLLQSGWDARGAAIAIDPELEAWVWSTSPHVDTALGWAGRDPDLRSWLVERGALARPEDKPTRPKEAVEEALRVARKPRSSALYQRIAGAVSVDRCSDPAFNKLRHLLSLWFGVDREGGG